MSSRTRDAKSDGDAAVKRKKPGESANDPAAVAADISGSDARTSVLGNGHASPGEQEQDNRPKTAYAHLSDAFATAHPPAGLRRAADPQRADNRGHATIAGADAGVGPAADSRVSLATVKRLGPAHDDVDHVDFDENTEESVATSRDPPNEGGDDDRGEDDDDDPDEDEEEEAGESDDDDGEEMGDDVDVDDQGEDDEDEEENEDDEDDDDDDDDEEDDDDDDEEEEEEDGEEEGDGKRGIVRRIGGPGRAIIRRMPAENTPGPMSAAAASAMQAASAAMRSAVAGHYNLQVLPRQSLVAAPSTPGGPAVNGTGSSYGRRQNYVGPPSSTSPPVAPPLPLTSRVSPMPSISNMSPVSGDVKIRRFAAIQEAIQSSNRASVTIHSFQFAFQILFDMAQLPDIAQLKVYADGYFKFSAPTNKPPRVSIGKQLLDPSLIHRPDLDKLAGIWKPRVDGHPMSMMGDDAATAPAAATTGNQEGERQEAASESDGRRKRSLPDGELTGNASLAEGVAGGHGEVVGPLGEYVPAKRIKKPLLPFSAARARSVHASAVGGGVSRINGRQSPVVTVRPPQSLAGRSVDDFICGQLPLLTARGRMPSIRTVFGFGPSSTRLVFTATYPSSETAFFGKHRHPGGGGTGSSGGRHRKWSMAVTVGDLAGDGRSIYMAEPAPLVEPQLLVVDEREFGATEAGDVVLCFQAIQSAQAKVVVCIVVQDNCSTVRCCLVTQHDGCPSIVGVTTQTSRASFPVFFGTMDGATPFELAPARERASAKPAEAEGGRGEAGPDAGRPRPAPPTVPETLGRRNLKIVLDVTRCGDAVRHVVVEPCIVKQQQQQL